MGHSLIGSAESITHIHPSPGVRETMSLSRVKLTTELNVESNEPLRLIFNDNADVHFR
jgi:hypothetical protein